MKTINTIFTSLIICMLLSAVVKGQELKPEEIAAVSSNEFSEFDVLVKNTKYSRDTSLTIDDKKFKLEEVPPIFLRSEIDFNGPQEKKVLSKEVIKKSIVPLSFITLGIALNKSKFERNLTSNIRGGIIDNFSLPIDDWIQYAPIAQIYIADVFGVKAKNHWFDQTKYLAITNIITGGITRAGKIIINKRRPSGSPHSFPSGHSSFSFSNSAVLYEEFKDTAPVLAYSGYAISGMVAGLRVVNNQHWFSDVLVGTGLGILVTKLVYHFEPLKNWNPFKNSKDITVIPEISKSNVSLYMGYRF